MRKRILTIMLSALMALNGAAVFVSAEQEETLLSEGVSVSRGRQNQNVPWRKCIQRDHGC